MKVLKREMTNKNDHNSMFRRSFEPIFTSLESQEARDEDEMKKKMKRRDEEEMKR